MKIYLLFFNLLMSVCNYATDNDVRLLVNAGKAGDIPLIETSLASGIPIDSLYKGRTALSEAIYAHQKNAAHYLIDKKSNVNLEYKWHAAHADPSWVLIGAVHSEQIDIIEHLLCMGANIECHNDRYETPLHEALCTNNSKSIDLLLAFGANTYAKDRHQQLPLDVMKWFMQHHSWEDEENEQEQNLIITSLENHMLLQQQAVNPTRSFFENVIARGYCGLVKQAIKNGMQPLISDLVLAKQQYLLLKQIGAEIPDFNNNSFTFRDKEISIQAFREIGKLLIQYLRFYESVGCAKYPKISKKGIIPLWNRQLPKEIASQIAWLTIN